MKILFVSNKTYRGQLDGCWWYFYIPLQKLGHETYFYDTVEPDEKSLNKVIEQFRPDLIFCILTGDANIAPCEPWNDLLAETQSGRTKTFNWFCDDTWRFDTFSKVACAYFTICSTPERDHLQKYKNLGYQNIIVGNWHSYSEYFNPVPMHNRSYAVSFIGAPTPSRMRFFNESLIPIEFLTQLSQKQLFEAHSQTQIGVNLSVNDNDPQGGTQMKQRMFEIPAGGGALLTQYHPGIEEYYKIDEEIMTFENVDEFTEKAIFLLSDEKKLDSVASAGHKRFLKDHNSPIRLQKVLSEIMAI